MISLSISRTQSALLPLLFNDSFVKTVHFVHGSEVVGVNLAKKSAKTRAFRVFLELKQRSNSEISIDYFVIRPSKFGLKMTCFKG